MLLCTCIGFNASAQELTDITKPKVEGKIKKYLSKKQWNHLFPNRYEISPGDKASNQDFYSYKNFTEAVSYFPEFLSDPDDNVNKRELCAFLANMAYETGGGWADAPGGYFKWGLRFIEERNCQLGCPQYTDSTKRLYPPAAGHSYHGRGGLQLSWNYNYGQFSEAMFGTKQKLLEKPELVGMYPVLAIASAIWFWVTPQSPKPSSHAIMNNTWKPSAADSAGNRLPGYGSVVNIINGGLECGKTPPSGTEYRYGYYRYFCEYFKVDPGSNIVCTTQKPFNAR